MKRQVSRSWKTATFLIGFVLLLFTAAWVVVTLSPSARDALFGKPVPVVHIHTVVGPTQYINQQTPILWKVGACAQNAANSQIEVVSCDSQFDWVVASETTDKSSCLYYSTDGGQNSQDEYVQDGNSYYCLVP